MLALQSHDYKSLLLLQCVVLFIGIIIDVDVVVTDAFTPPITSCKQHHQHHQHHHHHHHHHVANSRRNIAPPPRLLLFQQLRSSLLFSATSATSSETEIPPTKSMETAALLPKPKPKGTPAKQPPARPAITTKFKKITQSPNIAIVIDVENVRGKTDFALTHLELLQKIRTWTSVRKYAAGRTIAVVDHGDEITAHLLHRASSSSDSESKSSKSATTTPAICVTFAGPTQKADDGIARSVLPWLLYSPHSPTAKHVVVVTADRELMWRCTSVARSDIGSSAFCDALKKFAGDFGYGYGDVSEGVSNKFSEGNDNNNASGSKDDGGDDDDGAPDVAFNSILRRFAGTGLDYDRANRRKKRGGKAKRSEKIGRRKSRGAKKQQRLQQQQFEGEGVEKEDGQLDNSIAAKDDINASNTTTTTTTTTNVKKIKSHKNNDGIPKVEIISPQRFLEDLEEASREWQQQQQQLTKEKCNNDILSRLIDSSSNNDDVNDDDDDDMTGRTRGSSTRRTDETTDDRIVLAEILRRQLLECTLLSGNSSNGTEQYCAKKEEVKNNDADGTTNERLIVESYAAYINSLLC